MELSSLTTISPIDGRYSDQVNILRPIFSEFALLKYRIEIEIRWLQKLATCSEIQEIPSFTNNANNYLNKIIINFNENDAMQIKKIEKKINHDVKAVEYFLKEKLKCIPELKKVIEFIHFACTSEDINNLAYALILKNTRNKILLPYWRKIIKKIKKMATLYAALPMLSRTHGQIATPTTIGKEFANFAYRMERQYQQFIKIDILGKFNGAVGNYNAHLSAYPNINWPLFSKKFVSSLNIKWNPFTTQIEPHDYIAELFNCIARFNTIVLDFNQDIWGYLALENFTQKINESEVGSSTMPHKINPIDFENAEGNLGLANSLLNYFSNKLPISRWQRDLTDSTVLRSLGIAIAYSFIAYQATLQGLNKLETNNKKIFSELDSHWEVLGEAIQTVMKRYGIKDAYEKLKNITRGKNITQNDIKQFIDSINLPKKEKERLKIMTPANYIGDAIKITDYLK
ncbi:adenylosuccinate lyase [Arsenophonus symbiont of Ornithomya chloropus]|uniref:adenylosuccinate lyase n=1 Tax=Arsenophonus symbiont of Ornithomya chloropus TaxID=634121 RepID=UPI0032B1650C